MNPPSKVSCLVVAVLASGLSARAAEPFQVDTVHSSVLFKVKHQQVSYAYGRFNDVSGKFSIDGSDASKGLFDLTIKVDSVDTANAARDAHLKKTDFFDAAQFPTITFKSKSITATGKSTYDVNGDLTLHGVTKPVTFKVTVVGTGKGMRGDSIIGVEALATIKRTDFGMTFMVGPLGDEVTITAALEGSRK